jgi:hypothetical protein
VIRPAIITALQGVDTTIGGRDVALLAGLPYKTTIDALGCMLGAGVVVRFGSKYSSKWALVGTPVGAPRDRLDALEAVWRAAATPTPTGEARATPRPRDYSSVTPSKFFAP